MVNKFFEYYLNTAFKDFGKLVKRKLAFLSNPLNRLSFRDAILTSNMEKVDPFIVATK